MRSWGQRHGGTVAWRGMERGEGLRSAFYCNLPQFCCNFSVMLLLNKFIFPQRKILSLPWLSLGELYGVCVLICPACHLCGRMRFCFCVPKMSSTSGDSDSGKVKRPVKRGKGQGDVVRCLGSACMSCASNKHPGTTRN